MKTYLALVYLVAGLALSGCGNSDSPQANYIASNDEESSSSQTASSRSTTYEPIGKPFDAENPPAWFPKGVAAQLPALYIYTDSGEPVTSRENYMAGSFELFNDSEDSTQGALEIRGRGNSTWDWDKKPYRIKLEDSTPLLGMPRSKHWVLLANFADKTLIRNDIAFMFSRSLGMEFTPRDKHIELHFNGAYQGVYQLTDQIRIDNDRVDIPELDEEDTSDDLISGGYLLEIDFRLASDFCTTPFNQQFYAFCVDEVNTLRDTEYCIDSNYGMAPFCLKDPDDLLEPEWAAHQSYIENYLNQTEEALFGDNFTDPEVGYAAYLDVESTINYYIINELFKNADGASASAYLYKKRDDKLYFGPIWDFDLALGNAGYNGLDSTSGWHIRQSPWFDRLFQDPNFEQRVKDRWAELKDAGKINQLFEYAISRATWMDEQQEINFNLWPIFYWETWYTRVILGSYRAEVVEMIRWQHERAQWMDGQLSQ